MEKVSMYFMLFMIYSFMGWLMEVIVTIVGDHKLVNRGFLIGPYCPIYGHGCLLLYFLLRKYLKEPIILFFMAILICSILEYFTSYILEKIFHARWWDYSNRKFNINGRICLETMIPFGILGCLILYIVNPFFMKIISNIPPLLLNIIAIVLFIIYLADNIVSFIIIKGFKGELKKVEKDQTEEISKKVKKILTNKGILQRRLVKAFPHLKTSREALMDLQKKIEEKINK